MNRTSKQRPKSSPSYNGEQPAVNVLGICKEAAKLRGKFPATGSAWARKKFSRPGDSFPSQTQGNAEHIRLNTGA